MQADALSDAKKSEIENMAKRLGVEKYLNTEKTTQINAITTSYIIESKGKPEIVAESMWMDAKDDIEAILSDLSAMHNSREDLFLLGATNAGMESFDGIRTKFMESWMRLIEQYKPVLSYIDEKQRIDIDRNRDRVLSAIPLYGSKEERATAIQTMKVGLSKLEEDLARIYHTSVIQRNKAAIAERETTRSLLLAEAQAGRKEGSISTKDFSELDMLIGRKSTSLFEGQLKALDDFTDNAIVHAEMDRTLNKAGRVLKRDTGMSQIDSFFTTNTNLGRTMTVVKTDNTGDGMRVVETMKTQQFPTYRMPEEPSFWVGRPMHSFEPEPTIANIEDPASNIRVEQYTPNFHPSKTTPGKRNLFGERKSEMMNGGIYKKMGTTKGKLGKLAGGITGASWGELTLAGFGLYILGKYGFEALTDIKKAEIDARPSIADALTGIEEI